MRQAELGRIAVAGIAQELRAGQLQRHLLVERTATGGCRSAWRRRNRRPPKPSSQWCEVKPARLPRSNVKGAAVGQQHLAHGASGRPSPRCRGACAPGTIRCGGTAHRWPRRAARPASPRSPVRALHAVPDRARRRTAAAACPRHRPRARCRRPGRPAAPAPTRDSALVVEGNAGIKRLLKYCAPMSTHSEIRRNSPEVRKPL